MEPTNPYAPPFTQASPSSTATAKELYAKVPAIRRSGTCSALLVLGLLVAFAGPIALASTLASMGRVVLTLVGVVLGAPLLAVCIVVLTGDVYYDQLQADGTLKKWSVGNKVVAALMLGGWVYSIVRSFL